MTLADSFAADVRRRFLVPFPLRPVRSCGSLAIKHKFFVFVAGVLLGPSREEGIFGLRWISWIFRLLIHDWSKCLPSEWLPYANYFYRDGYKNLRHAEAEFHRAWFKHVHRQPHHWQHWVMVNDIGVLMPLDMPDKYIREMVPDWAGAGRAITGKWDLLRWFNRMQSKMKFTYNTQKKVHRYVHELSRKLES